ATRIHHHEQEVTEQGKTYTYPQPTIAKSASTPGSLLNRPGGSLLLRRGHAVPQAVKTIIRNSKLPRIDASWLETQHLQLQGNEIGSLDLSNSRISQLEISGNTIGRSVDFSHTQVKQANVQVLAKDQAKLEGSNIKLPR
ncbi:MAG: hypothetical protein J0I65_20515, partial [Variovorax sp.]|nr:hypothetical protein [Variovorax sp.]